jgi:dihydrofolate synthase/folylpolyglutamate synthase
MLALLGDPHLALPTLHVAGTNGKGSTVATVEALLRAKGLRVARYTSPHLVDFRERIVVDGRPVPEDAVVDFVRRWTAEGERLGATFFEVTTALAFAHFADASADVAIVETGLGGRLDSTNVVQPVAAAVTSIGLDHVQYLGGTLAEIAAEKAGIFKRGTPAVIGECSADVRAVLVRQAHAAGAAPIRTTADETRIEGVEVGAGGTSFTLAMAGAEERLRTPLVGEFQARNTATALLLLDAAGPPYATTLAEARSALPSVRLPGRFQRVGRYVFDVAHNPDGAAVLAQTLRGMRPATPVSALVSVLDDKDWRGMLRELAPVVDHLVLTLAPTAPASRAWSTEQAFAFATEQGWPAECEPDFDAALRRAAELGETVVVTGSFHTVGDAMLRLQVDPLAG